MEKCNDKYFGEMFFKYSWSKLDNFIWDNKNITVRIIAKAYIGQAITDIQRENYSIYLKNREEYSKNAQRTLFEFCKNNYDECLTQEKLLLATNPKDIIFRNDGVWGITFECKWEREMDLAVIFTKEKIEAGFDDILL